MHKRNARFIAKLNNSLQNKTLDKMNISSSKTRTILILDRYENATIKLTKQLDGSQGRTIFELAHQNPSTTIYWHLDNDYLGETSDVHQM